MDGVVALCHLPRSPGTSLVAEGAETQAEPDALQAIGCGEVQGYSIAFPMPDKQAREWLLSRTLRKPRLSVVGGRA